MRSLDLSWCPLLPNLLAGVIARSRLERLTLCRSKVTTAMLTNVMPQLPQLSYLDLSYSNNFDGGR